MLLRENNEVVRLLLRENNEGMTLVELIITIAITAIVFSMIVMIIVTASHGVRRTNENVNLQMEAQSAVSQLSVLTMEASNVVASTTTLYPDRRYLVTTPDYYYAFSFDASESKLYLIQVDNLPAYSITSVDTPAVTPTDEENLLAEYVKDFTINLSGKTAVIDLELEMGDQSYQITKKVKLRNKK